MHKQLDQVQIKDFGELHKNFQVAIQLFKNDRDFLLFFFFNIGVNKYSVIYLLIPLIVPLLFF